MLYQIVKFVVHSDQVDAFKRALIADKVGAQAEPGCVELKVFQGRDASNVFFAYERWQDQAALDFHVAQPYTQTVLKLAETVLLEPVEVMKLGVTNPQPVHEEVVPAPEDDLAILFFIFKHRPELRDNLLAQFETHIEQTRQEDGNLLFDLYTIDGKDDTLAVYEYWRNEPYIFNVHFQQPHSLVTGALMHDAVIGDMAQYMYFVTEFA